MSADRHAAAGAMGVRAGSVSTLDADTVAACVDAAARALALPLAAAHRPGVLSYFALAAALAAELEAVPLGPEDESASVFVPAVPFADVD